MRATSSVFKDIFENYQKDYEGPFDSSKPSYSLFKELDEHIKKIVDKLKKLSLRLHFIQPNNFQ